MKNSTRNILAAIAVSAIMVSTAQANLLVSSGSTLRLYTTTGTLITTYATDLSNAQGVAVDPSGNAYVSDLGGSRIRMFDPLGGFVRNVMDATYGGGTAPLPFALAWNPTVNGLAATVSNVTTAGNTRMLNFDVTTSNTIIGLGQSLGGNYEGLTYKNEFGGILYATVSNVGQFFNATGPAFNGGFFTGDTGAQLKGIAISPLVDRKYIADFANNRVYITQGSGSPGITTGLNQPLGITYDPSLNNIFVANFGDNNIKQYDSDGVFIATITVPASYLAYTAIPEPSTLALGLVALTALGLRRRRRA